MALCRVTGTLFTPDGDKASNYNLFLTRIDDTVVSDYLGAVVPQVVRVQVRGNGAVDFTILSGSYYGIAKSVRDISGKGFRFEFSVPDAATAVFENCIGAANPSPPTPAWLQRVEAAVVAAEQAAAEASLARDQVLSSVVADERVPTLSDRPAIGPSVGYVVYVIDTGISYRWDGSQWVDLGSGPFATKEELAKEVTDRRGLINYDDDAFSVVDQAGFDLLTADTNAVKLMGRVIALRADGPDAIIPTPDGSVAATVGDGALSLMDDGPLIVEDELGFELFKADTDGVYSMGKNLNPPSDSEIKSLTYDAYLDVYGAYRGTPRPFRRWVSSRADVISGLGRARIACIGDSNTMGHSAMGNGQHRRAQSYPTHLSRLSSDLGSSWGNFFGRAITESGVSNIQAYDPRLSLGSGWSTAGPASLGGEMYVNSTTSTPLTITPTQEWDSAEVYISIDEPVTVEIGVSGSMTSHTPPVGQIVKLTYTAPSLGLSGFNISRTSGSLRVIGAHCYKSGSGIDILNVGRSGWRSDQYASTSNYYSPLSALPALDADLWVIQLGLNDFDQGRDPNLFRNDIQLIAETGISNGASVSFIVSLTPGITDNYPWSDYREKVYEVSSSLNCTLIDVGILFGPYLDAVADGLVTNPLHPSYRGYAQTAYALDKLIM